MAEGSPKQLVQTLTGVPTEFFETDIYIYIYIYTHTYVSSARATRGDVTLVSRVLEYIICQSFGSRHKDIHAQHDTTDEHYKHMRSPENGVHAA